MTTGFLTPAVFFILSFCFYHSVIVHDYCKSNQPISLKHGVYQSEELINVWWWSDPGCGFQITFPLPSPLRTSGFLRDLITFLIHNHWADFHNTRPNNWCRQGNASRTFLEAIRQTSRSKSGLIRKSGLESRITFGWG